MKIRLSAVASPAVLLACDLCAQNLVSNGRFDHDVSGWQAEDAAVSVAFTVEDAGGSGASGSARVTNASPGGSNGTGIRQCIAGIAQGTVYSWGGSARIPAGQARTGPAFVGLRFYASPDCAGKADDQPRLSTAATGRWVSLSGSAPAPAGARSVEFLAFPSKVEAGGTLDVLYDDLFFFPPSTSVLTIPSAASIHGAAGTFFHTDLWVMNLSRSNAQSVTARFRCFAALGCDATPRVIDLAPRETFLLTDIVATFFASPESAGAIELTYDAAVGEIAATSRTYSPSLPAPTTGAGVPAVPAGAARFRSLFLGLASNAGRLSAGFRANAGAYNPSESEIAVTLELFDAAGARIALLSRAWAPHEAFQFSDVFAAAGAGNVVTSNATLLVTAELPLFPFVTVIDNRSGDFIWVTPVEDP